MNSFRTFLLEYLTDEQRDMFKGARMSKKAREDTDHYFGKKNDKVEGEVKTSSATYNRKSEVHQEVESHLGQTIHPSDYRKGLVKDKYGRDTKIGRLIKDNSLRNRYASDSAKAHHSNDGKVYKTSTHRGVEVMGQTNSEPDHIHPNGHSWGQMSCKNIEDGENKHFLRKEVKAGTLVHFVHDHDGKEIYRATLHPHHNHNGSVAYHLNSEYGDVRPEFTASAHEAAAKASNPHDRTGIFHIDKTVYDDHNGRKAKILHPSATHEDMMKTAKDPANTDSHFLSHHSVDSKVLEAAAEHAHHNVVSDIARNDNATPETLRTVYNRGISLHSVLTHPNTPHDVIDHAIADKKNANILSHNENLSKKHADTILSSGQTGLGHGIMASPRTTATQRKESLGRIDNEYVLSNVASHPNAVDHIPDIMGHPAFGNMAMDSLLRHRLSPSHVNIMMKSDMDQSHAWTLLLNHDVTDHHIATAIKHGNTGVMAAALREDRLTPDQIEHVKKHYGESDYGVYSALRSKGHM